MLSLIYVLIQLKETHTYLLYLEKKLFSILLTLGIVLNFQGQAVFSQDLLKQSQDLIDQADYTAARTLLQQNPPQANQAFTFRRNNQLGEICTELAYYDSVAQYVFQPANWEKLSFPGKDTLLLDRYLTLANWTIRQKKYQEASHYLERADSLVKQLGSRKYPVAQLYRTRVEMATGKFKAAGARLEALEKQVDTLAPVYRGDLYLEKGLYLQLYKKFQESLASLQRAEALYKQSLPDKHPKLGICYTFLSYTYRGLAQINASLQTIEQAIDIQENVLGLYHPNLATSYYYHATTLNLIGDFSQSEKYLRQAIQVYKKSIGNSGHSLGNYYASLGHALHRLSQYSSSSKAYEQALNYYQGPPVFRQIDKAYYNYSESLIGNEEFEQGLTFLDKAYQMRVDKFGENHPLMLEIYLCYGEAYKRMGLFEKARAQYGKCMNLESQLSSPGKLAEAYFSLAQIENSEGDFQEGISYLEKSLQQIDVNLELDMLDGFDITSTPNPELVLRIYKELAASYSRLEGPDKKANNDKALQFYMICEFLLDEMRLSFLSDEAKLNLGVTGREVFEAGIATAFDLFSSYGDPSYLETAFYLSGKSKSLLLLLALKESTAQKNAGIPEALQNLERSLELELANKKTQKYQLDTEGDASAELAVLEQDLFRLNKSRDSLIKVLEKQYPSYYQVKYDLSLPSSEELRQHLPDSMALLDYFLGERTLYVMMLDKNHFQGYRISLDEELRDRIQSFTELVEDPFTGETDADFLEAKKSFILQSSSLFEELLAPLQLHQLTDAKRLKIIPDGPLSYLNFGLLLDACPESDTDYRSLPYLLKSYDISYAYSIGQWWHVLNQASRLLLGDEDLLAIRPTYASLEQEPADMNSLRSRKRNAGLGPLYFSEKEIESIVQFFDARVLEGIEADEANFYAYASRFPLIQISGHAVIPDSAPEAAFIAFTDTHTAANDDSLMLDELYAQKLQAEMVVLSACETGMGRFQRGEGIMSLGRGFTYSGARSLIMSFWEVNDASTAQIMQEFYRFLAQGLPKDQALSQAQKSYIAQSDVIQSHPLFLGGFCGQWRYAGTQSRARKACSLEDRESPFYTSLAG